MMAITPLNMEVFNKAAVKIEYGKFISSLVEDFVTRDEMKLLLSAANLIISAQAGPVPVAGVINPIMNGGTMLPLAQATKQKRIAQQKLSETAVEQPVNAIEKIAGV
jgi:hypothetical protein